MVSSAVSASLGKGNSVAIADVSLTTIMGAAALNALDHRKILG